MEQMQALPDRHFTVAHTDRRRETDGKPAQHHGKNLAENVFSYPGLGSAVAAAGLNSDVPLLLGITLFSTLFVCVGRISRSLPRLSVPNKCAHEGACPACRRSVPAASPGIKSPISLI